jgi:hypothetical protein
LQKVSVTIFICMLLVGCVSLKKSGKNLNVSLTDTTQIDLVESIIKQNLTGNNFFIQKAEIEYIIGEQKQKFMAVIKFERPDRYLISLKSKTGIEGARIFINRDSLVINDRINKIVYLGNSLYLRRKLGFDQSFLPVIFGDFVSNDGRNLLKNQCINRNLDMVTNVNGLKVHYLIDCNKRKISGVDISDNYGNMNILLKFGAIKSLGALSVPRNIELNYPESNLDIIIKIIKIQSPWNGNVKISPAKGYELKELI